MTRAKWIFTLLILTLLLASILARCILSGSSSPPPDVPESWKCHRDALGEFEIWLPEEWEDLGVFRTAKHRLRDVVEGDESPILFAAFGSGDRCSESVIVEGYDKAFETYTPLVGEELAKEFVRLHPVVLADEAGKNVFPEPSTDIIVIEQNEGKVVIAYQSYVLDGLVRTIACVVTRNRVYGIHLDTIERDSSANIPTYERILETFRVK